MKKILMSISFFLMSTTVYADYKIHTWGYGDIMRNVLEGVSLLMKADEDLNMTTYLWAFKIFALLGLIMAIIIYGLSLSKGGNHFAIFKVLVIILVLQALALIKTVDVTIMEHSGGKTQIGTAVEKVPWLVAYPLSVFSIFEHEFSIAMEKTFMPIKGFDFDPRTPTGRKGRGKSLFYSEAGLLSPFSVMKDVANFRINDPDLSYNMNEYFIDCVYPDIISGMITNEELADEPNLWGKVFNFPAGIRRTKLRTGKVGLAGSEMWSCPNAYGKLSKDLGMVDEAIKKKQGIFPSIASSDQMLKQNFSKIAGTASEFFLNYSNDAQSVLQQSMVINQFTDSYQKWATVNNMSGEAMSVGISKASEAAKAKMAIGAVLATKYLPIMKGLILIILVGFIPILVLLMLTPMAGKVSMGFIMALLWITLWQFGDVILHSVIMVKANSFFDGIIATNPGDALNYTIATKYIIDTSITDYINMAGSMYWLIPTMAMMVAGGFSIFTMTALASSMAGKVDASASGAAQEASTGSLGMGNLSYNNTSAHSKNWARQNTMGYSDQLLASMTKNGVNSSLAGTTTGDFGVENKGLQENKDLGKGVAAQVTRDGAGNTIISQWKSTDGLTNIDRMTLDSEGNVQSASGITTSSAAATEKMADLLGNKNLQEMTESGAITKFQNLTMGDDGAIISGKAVSGDKNNDGTIDGTYTFAGDMMTYDGQIFKKGEDGRPDGHWAGRAIMDQNGTTYFETAQSGKSYELKDIDKELVDKSQTKNFDKIYQARKVHDEGTKIDMSKKADYSIVSDNGKYFTAGKDYRVLSQTINDGVIGDKKTSISAMKTAGLYEGDASQNAMVSLMFGKGMGNYITDTKNQMDYKSLDFTGGARGSAKLGNDKTKSILGSVIKGGLGLTYSVGGEGGISGARGFKWSDGISANNLTMGYGEITKGLQQKVATEEITKEEAYEATYVLNQLYMQKLGSEPKLAEQFAEQFAEKGANLAAKHTDDKNIKAAADLLQKP